MYLCYYVFKAFLVMTELHEAAAKDDVKTLQCLLVRSDIDIDAEDWDWGKRTALHIAACNGEFDRLKCFILRCGDYWQN